MVENLILGITCLLQVSKETSKLIGIKKAIFEQVAKNMILRI